jgi:hypothetical protein
MDWLCWKVGEWWDWWMIWIINDCSNCFANKQGLIFRLKTKCITPPPGKLYRFLTSITRIFTLIRQTVSTISASIFPISIFVINILPKFCVFGFFIHISLSPLAFTILILLLNGISWCTPPEGGRSTVLIKNNADKTVSDDFFQKSNARDKQWLLKKVMPMKCRWSDECWEKKLLQYLSHEAFNVHQNWSDEAFNARYIYSLVSLCQHYRSSCRYLRPTTAWSLLITYV